MFNAISIHWRTAFIDKIKLDNFSFIDDEDLDNSFVNNALGYIKWKKVILNRAEISVSWKYVNVRSGPAI